MNEDEWQKSTRSMANGSCVEIMAIAPWYKAEISQASNGCVEVAPAEVVRT